MAATRTYLALAILGVGVFLWWGQPAVAQNTVFPGCTLACVAYPVLLALMVVLMLLRGSPTTVDPSNKAVFITGRW
jgi:hypothetical protein